MNLILTCIEAARRNEGSVVLPEGDDERIVAAARQLVDRSIATPIVLGDVEAIRAIAGRAGIKLDGITILDPSKSDKVEHYAAEYVRARPKTRPGAAARQLRKPLFYGGMMVRCGDASAMLAGVAHPTSRVIKAASLTVGTAPGVKTPSSYFIMVLPEDAGALVFSDCAFNVDPDAAALADIALASALSAQRLLNVEPRVAIISNVTAPGARTRSAEKTVRAAEIARQREPQTSVVGGLEVDQVLGSDSASSANVLVFPDLETGNIAYKLTQYLAGATAVGPFLQGFAGPVSDLSRGASVDDIVSSAAVMLAGR